ncbi:helix-turn-helix domain containing protein [Diaphorobacter caeni]|uniref:helix-turn-helix domain containing protein n=1 Tax=Diaphorobacter caeni TaxID=2784387 RepID=UPI00188E8137|nr:helix-turn-helix domain containing protein [Diaphorobacter caeni]MBF5006368.1 hypothetical protein [Diaphorobacter caeni]
MNVDLFDRLDPLELSPMQLEPLQVLMPRDWPEIWREFATSLFITLISAPGADAVPAEALARLAMAQALGLAEDHGGTQPYVPVGALLAASSKARRVVDLLGKGMGYREVSHVTGLTPSRIRRIESDWRQQQIKARQGVLPLD